MSSCGEGKSCNGHWTEGYTHWINNNQTPTNNEVIRPLAVVTDTSNLIRDLPTGFTGNFDQHQS